MVERPARRPAGQVRAARRSCPRGSTRKAQGAAQYEANHQAESEGPGVFPIPAHACFQSSIGKRMPVQLHRLVKAALSLSGLSPCEGGWHGPGGSLEQVGSGGCKRPEKDREIMRKRGQIFRQLGTFAHQYFPPRRSRTPESRLQRRSNRGVQVPSGQIGLWRERDQVTAPAPRPAAPVSDLPRARRSCTRIRSGTWYWGT